MIGRVDPGATGPAPLRPTFHARNRRELLPLVRAIEEAERARHPDERVRVDTFRRPFPGEDEAACRIGGPWQPEPSRDFAELFDDSAEVFDRRTHTYRDETSVERRLRHRQAFRVCASCPVQAACAADAQPGDGFRGGVWQLPVSPSVAPDFTTTLERTA